MMFTFWDISRTSKDLHFMFYSFGFLFVWFGTEAQMLVSGHKTKKLTHLFIMDIIFLSGSFIIIFQYLVVIISTLVFTNVSQKRLLVVFPFPLLYSTLSENTKNCTIKWNNLHNDTNIERWSRAHVLSRTIGAHNAPSSSRIEQKHVSNIHYDKQQ